MALAKTVAELEFDCGDRKINNFMKSAGLGIEGIHTKRRLRITFAPQPGVTEEELVRAKTDLHGHIDRKAREMIEMHNASPSDLVIRGYRIVSITDVPDAPEPRPLKPMGKISKRIRIARNDYGC